MSTFQKLWANGAFRFGAGVLALVFAMGVLAPFLGTVDPAVMDYNNINRAAGHTGPFTLVDGTQVAHAFWLGTDNFGRDLYSRVLYGARVSLLVAISTAFLALIAGGAIGMLAGYFRAAWSDRRSGLRRVNTNVWAAGSRHKGQIWAKR